MAKFLSKDWLEEAGDIFEPHKLTTDQRTDWTAAVMYLHAVQDSFVPAGLGAGIVMLGGELGKGKEADNWVYWASASAKNRTSVRLSKDWGEWRKGIDKALARYGLDDPRTDEQIRTWTTVGTTAGAVVGAVLTALTFGTAAAGVAVGVGAGATAGYAAADASENKFAAALAAEDLTMAVTGSGAAQAVGATLGTTLGAAAGAAAGGVVAGDSVGDVLAGAYDAAAATPGGQLAEDFVLDYAGDLYDEATSFMGGAPVAAGSAGKAAALLALVREYGAAVALAGVARRCKAVGMSPAATRDLLVLLVQFVRDAGYSI